MSKKIKISIDLDGSLWRTTDLLCHLLEYKTGISNTAKDVKYWNFWHDKGLEKEFWETYDLIDKSRLRLSLEPYDKYVKEAIAHLAANYNIHFVTCNKYNEQSFQVYQKWFENHSMYVERRDFKFLGRKPTTEKLKYSYRIFADDSPEIAKEMHKYPNKFLLLANCRWNEYIKDSDNIKRFRSWSEVPKLVEKIAEKL